MQNAKCRIEVCLRHVLEVIGEPDPSILHFALCILH